jgi:hypothetical protein
VEQQGRSSGDLRMLWDEDFWKQVFSLEIVDEWDRLIDAFNQATGLGNEAHSGKAETGDAP